jgi:hypothetical protein
VGGLGVGWEVGVWGGGGGGGTRLASDRETTAGSALLLLLLTCNTDHKNLLRFVESCFSILLKKNRDGYVHVVTNGEQKLPANKRQISRQCMRRRARNRE